MMRYSCVPEAGLALLAILLFAAPAGAGHWPLEIFDVMDDQKVVVFLYEEDITSGPIWKPGDGAPPLTVGNAIKRIQAWIAEDDRLKDSGIHEIALKPIHGHEKEDRWYYLVELRNGAGENRFAVVLFSGKVIPAIVEPAAVK